MNAPTANLQEHLHIREAFKKVVLFHISQTPLPSLKVWKISGNLVKKGQKQARLEKKHQTPSPLD